MILLLNKLKLLAIGVSSANPIEETPSEEPNEMIMWIVILIAVVLACVLFGKCLPSIVRSLKKRKAKREAEKIQMERDAELERLHRIKEKNKRK